MQSIQEMAETVYESVRAPALRAKKPFLPSSRKQKQKRHMLHPITDSSFEKKLFLSLEANREGFPARFSEKRESVNPCHLPSSRLR